MFEPIFAILDSRDFGAGLFQITWMLLLREGQIRIVFKKCKEWGQSSD